MSLPKLISNLLDYYLILPHQKRWKGEIVKLNREYHNIFFIDPFPGSISARIANDMTVSYNWRNNKVLHDEIFGRSNYVQFLYHTIWNRKKYTIVGEDVNLEIRGRVPPNYFAMRLHRDQDEIYDLIFDKTIDKTL